MYWMIHANLSLVDAADRLKCPCHWSTSILVKSYFPAKLSTTCHVLVSVDVGTTVGKLVQTLWLFDMLHLYVLMIQI